MRPFRPAYVALLLFIFVGACFSSCSDDNCDGPAATEKTLFMYFPWSNNLTSYFETNIADMETAIAQHGLRGERVLVFFSSSSDEARLFEITCEGHACQRVTLKEYTNPPFTTAEGIASILNDVKTFAPASEYAMTIGCHGMGWVPVNSTRARAVSTYKYHWESSDGPMTRFFGGTSSAYQTDITTLAEGIERAGMYMEYILFDDCYMATVEVAYDLRHVTGHLIASTCEMMAYGMPYAEIGQYLLGDTDYEAICQEFYDFYSTYSTPCGTLSVTDCSRLDELAALMYEINTRCEYEGRAEEELQDLDGYRPTIFFDFGDYVRHLCDDVQLTATFEELLARTVTCKTHTGQYYTKLSGAGTDGSGAYPIHTFSGLTISDPSTGHPLASVTDRNNTAWYQATH